MKTPRALFELRLTSAQAHARLQESHADSVCPGPSGLTEHLTVYVFDLIGYGDSEPNAGQEVSVRVHGRVLGELLQRWH